MTCSLRTVLALMLVATHALACGFTRAAETPGIATLLQQLDEYPHTRQIDFSQREVIDHEVGLGALQKVRGEWRFKRSARLSGTLHSYTWLIENGFSSAEVMARLLTSVESIAGAEELFSCDGRACGRAVQWANRVFNQRVLFGREDLQRYSVFALQAEEASRLLAYSAERTADRQYLHVEWLQIAPQGQGSSSP